MAGFFGNEVFGRHGASRAMLCAAIAAATLLVATAVQAQSDSREQRQRRLNNQLRSLIESEQEQYEVDGYGPANRRRNPSPGAQVSSRLTDARHVLANFSQEAARLTLALDNLMLRNRSIRPLFTDAMKMRARAHFITQNAMNEYDHTPIAEEFRNLDSIWRSLSHRLRQIRGLDQTTIGHIERLDRYDSELSKILQVRAQLDRGQLHEATATLTADLRNLLDDIEIELERSPRRDELLYSGRQVYSHARDVVHVLNTRRAGHDHVVTAYREFRASWQPFATKLHSIANRYIERSVRRIGQADSTIGELLWLPNQIDRQELLYLTNTLMKDVDEFFVRAPLKLLITLPNNSNVLPVCDEFYGVCENLASSVTSDDSHADLIESYRYVEEAWQAFHDTFHGMRSQKAHVVLKDIEQRIIALRSALEFQTTFDKEAALELAANIHGLAEHVADDMRNWFSRQNVQFRNEALRASQDFVSASRELESKLVNGADVQRLAHDIDHLQADWQRVHDYIQRCNTADRHHMLSVSARMTPALIELHTMVAR